MPVRGSGLAVAVASTVFSPRRTTHEPWACLASFPVSKDMVFPPVISTETVVGSGFISYLFSRQEYRLTNIAPVRHRVRSACRGSNPWVGECQWRSLLENALCSGSRVQAGPHWAGHGYLRMPSFVITVLVRSESYF